MVDKTGYKFNWVIIRVDAIPKFDHPAGQIDNVVHGVDWHCEIYDPVDHSIHLEKGLTKLDLDSINPEHFTDFLELSKEQVCQWVNDIEQIEEKLVLMIQEWKRGPQDHEPRPVEIPWLASCCPDGKGMN
jgi:hypothetical protein